MKLVESFSEFGLLKQIVDAADVGSCRAGSHAWGNISVADRRGVGCGAGSHAWGNIGLIRVQPVNIQRAGFEAEPAAAALGLIQM